MIYSIDNLVQDALRVGFSQAGELNVKSLVFMPEVREMCSADTCVRYNRNWRCPPGCESAEAAAERISGYTSGLIVQTTASLEDDFDSENMTAAYVRHEKYFALLTEKLRAEYPGVLPLGADTCAVCKKCTYPDAPCRFPDRAVSPIEAYGLLVSKVCELSGMRYYYGKRTITYTGCYLLK
jgi:predicted metal-binding protein